MLQLITVVQTFALSMIAQSYYLASQTSHVKEGECLYNHLFYDTYFYLIEKYCVKISFYFDNKGII